MYIGCGKTRQVSRKSCRARFCVVGAQCWCGRWNGAVGNESNMLQIIIMGSYSMRIVDFEKSSLEKSVAYRSDSIL